jgi:hypothetical protein
MERDTAGVNLTLGQAQWIVERMIADRRISAAEVRAILSGMGQEIADIERRLADLRGIAGSGPVALRAASSPTAPTRTRKRRGGKKGHPRGIAGTLAVLLRSIPAAEHAAIAAIRADKGINAAISAAKSAIKKA